MNSKFYDRKGREISTDEYMKYAADPEYKKVAVTTLDDVIISTVWRGLDHSYGEFDPGSPEIFETVIFGGDHDQDTWRYSTEEAALRGHEDAKQLVTTPFKDRFDRSKAELLKDVRNGGD